jgi:F0F1-type ATP synthase epsilon subunit
MRVTLFRGARRLFEGTAAQVVLPGEEGEISIFDFHAPLLCTLGQGAVSIDDAAFPVQGGVARVARNAVTVLAR